MVIITFENINQRPREDSALSIHTVGSVRKIGTVLHGLFFPFKQTLFKELGLLQS